MKTSVLAACCHNCQGPPKQAPPKADYKVPRKCGLSAPITQSADKADAPDVAQSLRLISAWANNSVSFVSFPAVSKISRFSMQPIAVRRAGKSSPRHDHPERRNFGSSTCLKNRRQERAASAPPTRRNSVTAPNLL